MGWGEDHETWERLNYTVHVTDTKATRSHEDNISKLLMAKEKKSSKYIITKIEIVVTLITNSC